MERSGGNEVPVMGINYRMGVGGNKVPVEGIDYDIMVNGTYCDDGIAVEWNQNQMLRLCVMIRILTVIVTMELVAIGYIMSICDVLQCSLGNQAETRCDARERVVYGTAFDGGVGAVRHLHLHRDFSLNLASDLDGYELGGEGREGIELAGIDEERSDQSAGIQNELDHELNESELERESMQ